MDKKTIYSIFISSTIIFYFLFLNYCEPITMDDFWRIMADTLINHTFWSNLKHEYLTWTGRLSAQALIYIFFSKKYIFESLVVINIINSFAFYLFTIFSFKIVTRGKYKICSKDFLIYCFFFAIMFTWTGFITHLIWKTVAIQYFWGFVLTLVLYYYLIIKNKKLLKTSFLIGLFIGLYNEQFVAVLLLLSFTYFIESYLNNRTINKGIILFTIGCSIGGAILFAAPGNYIRMSEMSNGQNHSILDQLVHLYYTFKYSVWPKTNIVIWLLLLFFILGITNFKNSKKSIFMYTICLLISLLVMTPVVYSYGLLIRLMLIYYIIFFIAAIQQFYDNESIILKKIYSTFKRLYLLFGIGLVIIMFMIASAYYSLDKFNANRQLLLSKYHNQNIKNISIPTFNYNGESEPYGITFEGISCDTKNPNNQAFAKYYNFITVKANNC